jgi:hypothetical protein
MCAGWYFLLPDEFVLSYSSLIGQMSVEQMAPAYGCLLMEKLVVTAWVLCYVDCGM